MSGADAAAADGDVRAVPNVYFGTSAFAATVLRALAASPHRPQLVVTPPDRRQGRGRKLSPPPVAEAAVELGIEVHQTASVNREESSRAVLAAEPEAITVCAFGQLIGAPLIDSVPLVNVHPSLLPRWRGAAPIERAIMAGDERTGVCVMRLTAGLDEGPVGLREDVPIAADDDYGTLAGRLSEVGSRLLLAALDRIGAGTIEWREQPGEGATYAEKVESAERRVVPGRPAAEEALRIRALSPHIGAFAELGDGTRLGLRGAVAVAEGPPPGQFAAAGEALLLGCAPGALRVAEVQPPGKRWMAAEAYLRGHGAPVAAASAASG